MLLAIPRPSASKYLCRCQSQCMTLHARYVFPSPTNQPMQDASSPTPENSSHGIPSHIGCSMRVAPREVHTAGCIINGIEYSVKRTAYAKHVILPRTILLTFVTAAASSLSHGWHTWKKKLTFDIPTLHRFYHRQAD